MTMLGDKGELPIAMALANVIASSQMVMFYLPRTKISFKKTIEIIIDR